MKIRQTLLSRTAFLVALVTVCFLFARSNVSSANLPETQQRSVWDGVYTSNQASIGKELYDTECLSCHNEYYFSGDAFMDAWNGSTAQALFDITRTTMPQDAPGRLQLQQYTDILAYIFQINAFPAGSQDLAPDAEALGRIRIEPRPAQD